MRVAMVDPSLFTFQYDASLARALGSAGCEVTLHTRRLQLTDGMASGVDMLPQFYPMAESRLVRSWPKPVRLAVKAMDHVVSMRRLRRYLQAARPDVIHFQWLPLPVLDSRLLNSFRKLAPLVLTVHDTDPFNGSPAARLQRLGVRQALAGFSRLIVHTRQGQARLVAQGLPESRMAVLPHGIPELLATKRLADADRCGDERRADFAQPRRGTAPGEANEHAACSGQPDKQRQCGPCACKRQSGAGEQRRAGQRKRSEPAQHFVRQVFVQIQRRQGAQRGP